MILALTAKAVGEAVVMITPEDFGGAVLDQDVTVGDPPTDGPAVLEAVFEKSKKEKLLEYGRKQDRVLNDDGGTGLHSPGTNTKSSNQEGYMSMSTMADPDGRMQEMCLLREM
jgi:hypothetical protein